MITATAIVNNVDVVFAADEDFVTLAKDFIDIEYLLDMDLPGEQQLLWN